MKAVVANPAVTGCLEIGDVTAPVADSNEALVAVTSISLNRGELRRAVRFGRLHQRYGRHTRSSGYDDARLL